MSAPPDLERLLRDLREAQAVAKLGSWTTDLGSMAVTWSDETHHIFETDAGAFAPTHDAFLARVHPDDRAAVDTAFADSLTKVEPQEIEHRIVVNGRLKVVRERWQVVHDETGTPIRAIGTCQDITERRAQDAERLRSQRLESIGNLAGGIAHDLNNLLAPILMSVALLREDERDPERAELLSTIDANARRGADLVRKVLTYARGQDGVKDIVDLPVLVREVTQLVRETFPRNIEVEVVVPPEVPAVVGDATQLHQVLMNLAVNARDAMRDGGRLRISLEPSRRHDQPGVWLEVADTGVGMAPELLDQIFDPFFTTKDIGHGTGLGLSTVQAIVAVHRGHIDVTSTPGQGSCFRVWWPAAPATAARHTPPPAAAHAPRGAGQMVLVVDDEASIRQLARQTLEHHGYRVQTAANGREAVEILTADPDGIALVLTDMSMPEMDGLSAIQAMRRIKPSVRILTSSGLPAASATAQARTVEGLPFIAKPYAVTDLLQAVALALAAPARRA